MLFDCQDIAYDEICLSDISINLSKVIQGALLKDHGHDKFPYIYYGTQKVGGVEDLQSYM